MTGVSTAVVLDMLAGIKSCAWPMTGFETALVEKMSVAVNVCSWPIVGVPTDVALDMPSAVRLSTPSTGMVIMGVPTLEVLAMSVDVKACT